MVEGLQSNADESHNSAFFVAPAVVSHALIHPEHIQDFGFWPFLCIIRPSINSNPVYLLFNI